MENDHANRTITVQTFDASSIQFEDQTPTTSPESKKKRYLLNSCDNLDTTDFADMKNKKFKDR